MPSSFFRLASSCRVGSCQRGDLRDRKIHKIPAKWELHHPFYSASFSRTWFTSVFPADYQATHLFEPGLQADVGLAALPGGRPDVLVSTPERALLELLSDVGKGQELEEARHLVESARALRQPVLEELLAHLKRIKVARLAHALAEELGLSWAGLARKHSERLGEGRRWVSTTRSGERLNLKRPT